MRRFALIAAVIAVPALLLARPAPVHAGCNDNDDDWEVGTGSGGIDMCAIEAYQGILKKDPFDTGALAKLLRWKKAPALAADYEKKLAKKPDDYAFLVILGRLSKMQGDEGGALARFEAAAAVKAGDPELLLELGALYRNANRSAEAKDAYDKALAKTKSKEVKKKALRALADIALGVNDIETAKGYFDQYLALEPKNPALRVELGDALLAAQKWDEAVEAYRIAEKQYGSDKTQKLSVVVRIGQALEGKGSDTEAVAEYKRAINMAPKGYYIEVEVTARIIDIYRRKQDLATLLGEYEAEWAAKKRGHFEWSTLGALYEETGSQDKAIDAYQKAVKKSPWELETQRKLIQLLENVGREDEAIKQYEIVVKEAPSDARFQIELAERYERRGELDKALAALKKLEKSFPSDPGVMSALADLYQRWGKDALALAAYEKLAKLEPDDIGHLVVLGEQYWSQGDKAGHDKALATWKRIAKANTATALAKLGDVLAEHGMQIDGLAHYAAALKKEPKNAELYKGRAAIYEGQKQWQEAMTDWKSAYALFGDKPQDRSAKREARRHIVSLLARWGAKEAEFRNEWQASFKYSGSDAKLVAAALDAGYFLVEYFDRRPQTGEPRTTLERLRTMAPTDQDVITDLVKSYRAIREFDKAILLLLELEQLAPQRKREIYTQIAEIKTDARQDDEAIEWAKKAVEISNHKDPIAWERLAERFVDMQRMGEAIEAYEQALKLDKSQYKVAFALSGLYIQSSQPAKAAQLYRQILTTATDDETLLKAGREAIDLEELTGTLGELEKAVSPLSFQMSYKPIYRRILVDLYLRYVPSLVHGLRHGSADKRKAARKELDRLGAHGLKPLLEALNDDKDINQQRGAVSVLGHLGNKGAAAPLVRLARTEPKTDDPQKRIGTLQQSLDWEVRVEALVGAGRLGDPGVITDVLALAQHDEVAMREAAVFTLGRTKDKRAVSALITALDDRRESVQSLACMGLASVDDKDATKAVIAVVGDGKRHDLARASCAWALGVRKTAGGATALTTALTDNRGEAQRVAAWALGQLGDTSALPDVIRAYFTRDDGARDTLTWAVAHLAGAAAAAPTTADLTDYPLRNGKFHTSTAVAKLPGELPEFGDGAAIIVGHEQAIAEGIRSALGEHRDMVLAMLDDLDGRADGLALGSLVPAGAITGALATSLDTIGKAITDDVAAHLGDRDAKVRAVALSVTAKIGGAGVDAALIRGLEDETSTVRQAAMRAMVAAARRGALSSSVKTALVGATAQGTWQDRTAATRALGELGQDADLPALTAALADPSSFVREAAAQALGGLRATSAVDELITAADDDIAEVRLAVVEALVAIGDAKAKAKLAELAADDPDDRVRAAASPN